MTTNLAFFQRWVGSREACFFDSRNGPSHISVTCHASHGIEISSDERLYVSVRDARRCEFEQAVQIGSVVELKSLDLDATLLLRLWAGPDTGPSKRDFTGLRMCGDVRVPLIRLAATFNSMLYHSWLSLDSPGLHDSVASIGILDEDGSLFDQRLVDGVRQLMQPKACFSICKSADLGIAGRLVMQADAPDADRVLRWGALLRSQQQHAIMSAAFHLQSPQLQEDPPSEGAMQIRQLGDRLRSQSATMQELRKKLEDSEEKFGTADPKPPRAQATDTSRSDVANDGCVDSVETLENMLAAQKKDLSSLRELVEKSRKVETPELSNTDESQSSAANRNQVEALQASVAKLKEEASRKIETANERIRVLREERDELFQEGQRVISETEIIISHREELESENRQLLEQKQALLRIVEDLHQTCVGAGLESDGRRSLDEVTLNLGFS
eukprot:TRINITY_DN51102_c0_g1_i1.p1 TRINITY_DN51102_c0_g1~~TRINITY_DN51102_c0_g1_i1.p1  ORF type:complete len:443 (-),score=64.30 TRINITY_DN51102_c0_g1_i1:23-1351(-)